MKIENQRTSGRNLLFTVKSEDRDPNVSNLCSSCILRSNGCSNEVDPSKGIILARVNLDSLGVKSLINNDLEVPCGATSDIKFKA